ncbi:hypothetical protein RUND412_007846, partial [Rhizina undulata]
MAFTYPEHRQNYSRHFESSNNTKILFEFSEDASFDEMFDLLTFESELFLSAPWHLSLYFCQFFIPQSFTESYFATLGTLSQPWLFIFTVSAPPKLKTTVSWYLVLHRYTQEGWQNFLAVFEITSNNNKVDAASHNVLVPHELAAIMPTTGSSQSTLLKDLKLPTFKL